MNNDINNEGSRSWTDPITGEIYPGGNPHVSLGKSTVAPTQNDPTFADPLPPGAVPESQLRVQAIPQPVRNEPQVQPIVVQRNDIQVRAHEVRIPNGITKFCEHCGSVIAKEAVVCPACGCQVAALQQVQSPQPIIINNTLASAPVQYATGTPRNKWMAFVLCFFFGYFGMHRFYEGKMGTGILYALTFGLFGIGWLVDIIRILLSPNPYYVK